MNTPSTLERHIWGDQARRISNVFKTHFYRHDLCEVTLLNRSFICLFFSFYCSWSIYVCNSSVVMLSSYCPSLIIFLHRCLVLILASTLLILLFYWSLFPQLFQLFSVYSVILSLWISCFSVYKKSLCLYSKFKTKITKCIIDWF